MQNLYSQCLMRKAGRYTVGFISAKHARVGNIVRIDFPAGPEQGWRVESAGPPIRKTDLDRLSRQYRRQRLGSEA